MDAKYRCLTCPWTGDWGGTHAEETDYEHSIEMWCSFHQVYEDVDTRISHCQHCGGPNH